MPSRLKTNQRMESPSARVPGRQTVEPPKRRAGNPTGAPTGIIVLLAGTTASAWSTTTFQNCLDASFQVRSTGCDRPEENLGLAQRWPSYGPKNPQGSPYASVRPAPLAVRPPPNAPPLHNTAPAPPQAVRSGRLPPTPLIASSTLTWGRTSPGSSDTTRSRMTRPGRGRNSPWWSQGIGQLTRRGPCSTFSSSPSLRRMQNWNSYTRTCQTRRGMSRRGLTGGASRCHRRQRR
mmetsp:Transcript_1610/g.3456  ORF Transcript_1610/g.3456 Transcript_1610/m.3456 type:complete len:234 (+) Transcript_1610:500-1201(+)